MNKIKEVVSKADLVVSGSAKFFVMVNGETTIESVGRLNGREIRTIRVFIKENYKEMYLKWTELSDNDFYNE